MNLSAPTNPIFIASVVIAIVALLMALDVVNFVPVESVYVALLAYVVLMLGNILKKV